MRHTAPSGAERRFPALRNLDRYSFARVDSTSNAFRRPSCEGSDRARAMTRSDPFRDRGPMRGMARRASWRPTVHPVRQRQSQRLADAQLGVRRDEIRGGQEVSAANLTPCVARREGTAREMHAIAKMGEPDSGRRADFA